MKTIIRNVIALSVLAIVATSCSKDDDTSGQKRVEFPEQAEKVLDSNNTNKTSGAGIY